MSHLYQVHTTVRDILVTAVQCVALGGVWASAYVAQVVQLFQ